MGMIMGLDGIGQSGTAQGWIGCDGTSRSARGRLGWAILGSAGLCLAGRGGSGRANRIGWDWVGW